MLVGLVLATIEDYKTSVAPTEGSVGIGVFGMYEQVGKSGRVGIAYFMVATNEVSRCFCYIERFGNVVHHAHGLRASGWFGEAISIEDDEIMRNLVYYLCEAIDGGVILVQVIENDGSKLLGIP